MADSYKLGKNGTWRNRIVGYENVDPEQLLANPANFRVHPKTQQNALAGALNEIGWIDDVIVNRHTDTIIDGHLRVTLALRNGEPTVPVKYVDLSEDEEKLALATFDPITAMATHDAEILDTLLRDISTGDEHLQQMLADMAADAGLYLEKPEPVDAPAEIDRAEELREKWGVETGSLWVLDSGKGHPHRLICGDCTDADVVARLMDGERAQILFTSPPYWVGFDYEQEDKWSEVLEFIGRFCRLYVAPVADDGRIVINTGTVQAGQLTGQKAHMRLLIDAWAQEFERNGWLMRYVRFWVKDGGLLHTAPQSDCIDQHTEFIGYFYNPKAKFRGQERTGEPWAGKGYWDDIPGAARQSGHIAAFPVELASRNIQLFTRNGELVLESFAGSGTTGIACENLGRQARMVEISPAYVAVILERWATATNGTPQRVE